MTLNTDEIRQVTRIALPTDDSYLYRLGVALYGFASINSFMIEVISHLDSQTDTNKLQESTSGEVLNSFRHVVKRSPVSAVKGPGRRAADAFETLNTQRTHFVHASPITNDSGEQILYRYQTSKGNYFEVTSLFLDDFIENLETSSDALYEIREVVRQNL